MYLYKIKLSIIKLIGILDKYNTSQSKGVALNRGMSEEIHNLCNNLEDYIERYVDNQVRYYFTSERKQIINGLINGEYSDKDDIKIRSKRCNLFQKYNQYCVITFVIDNYAELSSNKTSNELYSYKHAISNTFHEYTQKHVECETIITSSNAVVIVINGDLSSLTFNNIRLINLCKDTIDYIKQNNRLDISCGMGLIVNSLIQIEEAYRQARIACEYRFIKGKGLVIQYSEIEDLIEVKLKYSIEKIENMVGFIKQSRGDKANEILNSIVLDIKKVNVKDSKEYTYLLITNICRCLDDLDISSEYKYINIINRFNKLDDLDEIVAYTRELIKRVVEHSNEKKYKKTESMIVEILDYIEDNYSNPNFSISDLEQHVNYSGNHIRNMFRSAYGCTPTEYLVDFRINKAKEILERTDLKATTVAEKVGYLNSKYFYSLFKKHTGMTTYEYRVNSQNKN